MIRFRASARRPLSVRPLCARGLLAALGLAVLLPACSVLPRPEPVDTYLLPSAAAPATGRGETQAWSLRIAQPAAGGHLASARIVVLPEPSRVSVYKGASWSDPAPVLLRDRLFEAFRTDGRVTALSSDERRLHADFELDSDLRAFQSEYRDGEPEIVIRLDARLVRPLGRRIVASRHFELRRRVAGTAVPEVVRAFGAAADALSVELVEWVIEEAQAARP
ncbi:ABC-type transport auxiliary lipoprotein family protein [Thauera phenolivorans]|nr:ABC-type transport auxiliary lipoprotein family protein [Thauera phenolivorans]